MENIALVTVKIPAAPRPKPVRAGTKQNKFAMVNHGRKMAPLGNSQAPNTTFASGAPPPQDATLGVKFVSAGTAACIADMATFPLDTAKVRLQIQGESGSLLQAATRSATSFPPSSAATATASALASAAPKYRGLLHTVATVSREEGVRALYSGLIPGLQRQMAFASVRIGLYDAVKTGYGNMLKVDPNNKNIGLRVLAGITTGGAAVIIAQPTDVVKVRMQAQSRANPRYPGCVAAYRTIAIEEGARGLWRGCLPNVTRNAVVNCTELVSYDLIKEALITRRLLTDNIPCHFLSAVGAGFFTTLLASPIDVVKTRFMNAAPGQYAGAIDCAKVMYREAGLKTFYKGCVPAFLRFGPWNVVMFVSYEQLKRLFTQMSSDGSKPQPRSSQSIKQSNSSSRYM